MNWVDANSPRRDRFEFEKTEVKIPADAKSLSAPIFSMLSPALLPKDKGGQCWNGRGLWMRPKKPAKHIPRDIFYTLSNPNGKLQ